MQRFVKKNKKKFTYINIDYYYFLRTNESDVVIRHKVKIIFQKIQNLKVSLYFFKYLIVILSYVNNGTSILS